MRARLWKGIAEGVGVGLVLLFVFAVTYLPHLDPPHPEDAPSATVAMGETYAAWVQGDHTDYPFPIHADENAHWVFMTAVQRQETLKYDDPSTGEPRAEAPLSLDGHVHERGFHVAVSQFQEFTGVEWVNLFRWLPALWMAITAICIWAALRPGPGALFAAALVALAPTSVRFLGPGFLVPIGFGLAWIAAGILLAPSAGRNGKAGALLLILTVWAFFIHLIAGFAVLGISLLLIPFTAARSRREALLVAGIAAIPVAWLATAFIEDVAGEARIFNFLPIDFTIFSQLGRPFLYAWVVALGVTVLFPPGGSIGARSHAPLPGQRSTRPAAVAVWTSSVLSILTLAMILANVALDIRRYALYDRWHQIFLLFAAVPVGYALGVLARETGHLFWATWRRFRLPRAGAAPWVAMGVAGLVALGSFHAVTDTGVEYHMRTPYYRITNREEFANFKEAAAANDSFEVFLVHPWKAPIYTALSGKKPYTVLHPGDPPVNWVQYVEYVSGKHGDAVWLVERDITQVLDRVEPTTPEYERHGVQDYRLRWEWAQRLDELRRS